MRDNIDQNNFEYGYFLCSEYDWLIGYLPEPVKGAVPRLTKGDNDSDVGQVKPQVKTIIESQLKEIQFTKIIMTLSARLRKYRGCSECRG